MGPRERLEPIYRPLVSHTCAHTQETGQRTKITFKRCFRTLSDNLSKSPKATCLVLLAAGRVQEHCRFSWWQCKSLSFFKNISCFGNFFVFLLLTYVCGREVFYNFLSKVTLRTCFVCKRYVAKREHI